MCSHVFYCARSHERDRVEHRHPDGRRTTKHRPHVSPDPCRPARRDRVLLAARSAAVRRAAAGVRCDVPLPVCGAAGCGSGRSARPCGLCGYTLIAPGRPPAAAPPARSFTFHTACPATSYFELVSCVCIKTVIFPHSRFARPGYYVHARPGGAPPGPAAQPPTRPTPCPTPTLRPLPPRAPAHAPRTARHGDNPHTRYRAVSRDD